MLFQNTFIYYSNNKEIDRYAITSMENSKVQV